MIEHLQLPDLNRSYTRRTVDGGTTVHEWTNRETTLAAHRTGTAPWVLCSIRRGQVHEPVSDRWLVESLLNMDEDRWYTISQQVWWLLENRG